MFLRILKSNQAYNLILFPLMAALFWIRNFMNPGVYDFSAGETNTILFRPIFLLVANHPMLQVIFSLLLLILLAFIIQRLNSRYSFYRVRTLLPPSLFVILIAGIPTTHFLHPVYFAALFFLLSIHRAFGSYDNKLIFPNCFDSGFLLGIGSLFYFNLIYFLPASLLGLRILNREFSWRNLALHFIGFLIPWIFSFSFYYIFDKIPELLTSLNQNLFVSDFDLPKDIVLLVYAGFWGLILFLSGLSMIRRFDEQKISTRKFHSVFIILGVTLTGILVLSPSAAAEMMVLLAIPSSYMITYFLISTKRKFWPELIFFVLVVLAAYLQVADKFPIPIVGVWPF